MAAFGDAEAAVVAIIATDTAVQALGDVGVATDLIGYEKPARWVKVARTGGVPTRWMGLDNPSIEVECYAADKGAADDLAEAARAAIFAARGVYTGHGLELYDALDTKGITWSPDPLDAQVARYMFALSIVTRPTT